MKRKLLTTAFLVCCVAICMAAAFLNIAGTWTGNLKMTDGNTIPLSYTFKQDGDKVTGMATSPQGEVAIESGKIAGDVITFSVNVQGMDIPHSGKIYADSIAMDVTVGDDKLHSKLLKKAN
ncbi:glycoside hydrolase [Mucilaginibacter glaciei]|uniref:Glycoside hydrolase n=1 Tax=Mucilaginibacter glaciei TaxID=2772109 RepID=A0A926NPI3_9SPHI|nr:glycoside hydrolase [Mucilaginibacter glaciei]MBD1392687.1 glycoside hydrolase [Mucilaginibacter glaciei]